MTRPIGIIAAMEPELRYLRRQLQSEKREKRLGHEFYCGLLNGQAVVLVLSGIGKVNAAAATAVLAACYAPDAVINTGSAGALGSGIAIGDVVIGTATAHHDVDVCAFGYAPGQVPQLPLLYPSDAHLVDLAFEAASGFARAKLHRGLIVSGDQFVAAAQRIASIRRDFPQVAACEMEAAAIAQVCYRAEIPFVVIRAISDHADEEADISFETFIETAGAESAQMVARLVAAFVAADTT